MNKYPVSSSSVNILFILFLDIVVFKIKLHFWYELLDNCAYHADFEKEKIVYSEIVQAPQFYLDFKKYFVEATAFILTGNNLKFLVGFLNSKPAAYIFKNFYSGGGLGEKGYRYKKIYIENMPIPRYHSSDDFISAIDDILDIKNIDQIASIEKEIDYLVYKLYNLSYDEIKLIEK